MSVLRVGLMDTTGKIDVGLVQAVAAALNVQVTRDLPRHWPVQATVQFLPDAHSLPAGVWPVMLVASLPPGEGGFHFDQHNQPFAKVIATPDDNSWSIDASHETIEMLVDPSGNRLQSSNSIGVVGNDVKDGSSQFNYLVEACDPCEANGYGYQIQGVLVSDFITPHFYDSMATPGTPYSFTGAITRPRQVLPGGYISFVDLQSNEWEQILWLKAKPRLKKLGPASGDARSMRQWVHGRMGSDHDALRDLARRTDATVAKGLEDRRRILASIAEARSRRYQDDMG